jgi:hypothetical protein
MAQFIQNQPVSAEEILAQGPYFSAQIQITNWALEEPADFTKIRLDLGGPR